MDVTASALPLGLSLPQPGPPGPCCHPALSFTALSPPCAEPALQGSLSWWLPGCSRHPVCPQCYQLCQCHCALSPCCCLSPGPALLLSCPSLAQKAQTHQGCALQGPCCSLCSSPPRAQAHTALSATNPYAISGCSSVKAAWGEEKTAFSDSHFQKL